MATTYFDAIVIGLGGVGTFALRALSKGGNGKGTSKFLGVEIGSLKESSGHSSRGLSRIYRRAYFEHSNYVPWIEHSLNVFREMEQESGQSLMRQCGTILIEQGNDQQSSKRPNEFPPLLRNSWHSAELYGIPVEFLDTKELPVRYPQFQSKDHDIIGLLEPGGGVLRPERIMRVALEDSKRNDSVTILEQVHIQNIEQLQKSISSNEGQFELSLQSSVEKDSEPVVVTTNKLLLSMGGWTSELVPMWKHILHPVRQMQGWIDTSHARSEDDDEYMFSCSKMPSFVYKSPFLPIHLYGLPGDDGADNFDDGRNPACWLKVGLHKQTPSPDGFCFSRHSPVAEPNEITELEHAIPHAIDQKAWQKSDGNSNSYDMAPTLTATKPCLYTMSPDTHFVIGSPGKNVFAITGLSGHGYKMTPALGQMMADFAFEENVKDKWKCDFCSPTRFDSQ